MELRQLISKLKPLMPNQARQWQRLLDHGDPDVQALIEPLVKSHYRRVFGSTQPRSVLSLPPRNLARGAFKLGQIMYEQPKWSLGLHPQELLQHISIFGRSGAGKTNAVFHLLQQLVEQEIPVLFLDWKRTARHCIPLLNRSNQRTHVYTPSRTLSPFPFNPFMVPPGTEVDSYTNQVVDVLGDAYSLGDGARSVVQRALTTCYRTSGRAPTIKEVIQEVSESPDTGRHGGWRVSALRALESVEFAGISAGDPEYQQAFAKRLLTQTTIVELDGLSQGAKEFLLPLLCLWLYSVRLASSERERLRFVIVVEEAHHVLHTGARGRRETTMEMLLRQCRELGMAFVIVDQHPAMMSTAALGNTFASMILGLKDPSDIAKAAGLSNLSSDQRSVFTELRVGEAVVKLQDRWLPPVKIQIPWVQVPKGMVTDSLLSAYLSGNSTLSGSNRPFMPVSGHDPRSLVEDTALLSDELQFVTDVLDYPDDGVDKRYRRLGLPPARGTRMRDGLVARGVLQAERVRAGRVWKIMLRLAPGAAEQFPRVRQGSIAHEYWKRFYRQRLTKAGFEVRLEAPRKSGWAADLIATRGGERLVIEVETGKSDVAGNVRRDLLEGFDQVIVVVPTKAGLPAVERKLGKVGLLIPPRVRIVIGDHYIPTSKDDTENSHRTAQA